MKPASSRGMVLATALREAMQEPAVGIKSSVWSKPTGPGDREEISGGACLRGRIKYRGWPFRRRKLRAGVSLGAIGDDRL